MGRSPSCDNNGLKKGPWTPEEDQKLVDYISRHGHGSWSVIPKHAGLNRCSKSCRLRWTNYLRPDIKRGKFSDEEERLIINLHSILGNKWSRIAAHLPGRTDNEIKNFWNTHVRRKLLRMGIDPNTHKPRTDLDVLVNLSQLIFAPTFGNLMNPRGKAFRLQADAAQLAKIQLLQNMLPVININTPMPHLERTSPPGSHYYTPFEGLVNSTSTLHTNPTLSPLEFPNPGITLQPSSNYQTIGNSWQCFDGGFRSGGFNINSNSLSNFYDIQTENQVPALVTVNSPENSNMINQMETKINPTCISTQPRDSSIHEAWASFMEAETGDSFWKDILD